MQFEENKFIKLSSNLTIQLNNALKMITVSYDIALHCYYLKITIL